MTTATEVKTETPAITPDEFDKAFDEAIKAESTPAKVEAAPATETKTETTPAKVEAAPATETKTESAPAKVEAAPATETKTETTPAPDARALAEEAARKIAAEAAEKIATEARQKAEAEALEIKDPVLTEEQTQALESFKKEWPDVAKALDIKAAHDTAVLETKFARALTAIVQKVYADIAPMAQSTQSIEANQYRAAVLQAHPDFDTHLPNIEAWINKQPAYLTDAYKRVYNEGTVQEVNDLVTRYKEANGIGTQVSTTPAAPGKSPETKPEPRQPSAAAKTAASELAPVASQRSIPAPSGADPNDYDGAFAEAAAAETAHR